MDPDKVQPYTPKIEDFIHQSMESGVENNCSILHPQIAGVSHLDGLSSYLLKNSPLVSSDSFRAPQSPMTNRSKFGATGTGRSPSIAGSSGLRGPPGVAPASSLYSAVISPSEMAEHEAMDFKNVKGVYKNCRGIWAAQWTDERGQRHTKYFNPKYYTTENEARIEAFKFKLHITREIELRGGIQKRRTPASAATAKLTKLDGTFLDAPYTRERQKRPGRKALLKGRREMMTYDLYNSGFPPGCDSQNWLSTSDHLFLQQSSSSSTSSLMQRQQEYNGEELEALSNSSCSPLSAVGSPAGAMFYSPQTFDSIFLPASAFQNQYLSPQSIGFNSTFRMPNITSGEQSAPPSSATPPQQAALPAGTSFCLCGCGDLAISPAQYSAHHHTATSEDLSRKSQVAAAFDSPSPLAALFPGSSADFFPDIQTPPSQQGSAACRLTPQCKRSYQEVSDQSDPESKRFKDSPEERPVTEDGGNKQPSFSFDESVIKSYAPSYPTKYDQTIAALLGQLPGTDRLRETMRLLTSSSSAGEGSIELGAGHEFSENVNYDYQKVSDGATWLPTNHS